MNILTGFDSNVKKMTSIEIADLLQSRHDNVKRTIERLAVADVIALPPMEDIKNHQNRPMSIYTFAGEQGKRDSIIVVAQLCPEFTARLVDRWAELEAQQNKPQQPPELSRLEILQIALQAEQQNIALQQQVHLLEPKAQALEVIANTDNTYTIRDCAKTIGIGERKLVQLLLDKGWVYRDSSDRLQPYSQKCDQKVFINRPSKVIKNSAGEEHVYLQMRVTAYGLTRITGLVNRMNKVAA